ncbi:hypothetical protein TorRG33x02_057820, partial [Trema orientale]
MYIYMYIYLYKLCMNDHNSKNLYSDKSRKSQSSLLMGFYIFFFLLQEIVTFIKDKNERSKNTGGQDVHLGFNRNKKFAKKKPNHSREKRKPLKFFFIMQERSY